MEKPNPSKPSAAVTAMSADWPMIDALLGGTSAMRAAGKMFLPKNPAESEEAYTYRKSCSVLFNGFRRTVETLASKPFSDPLRLGEDVPEKFAEYCEDIDLEGRDLQAFAHDVFRTAMGYGLSHILVDHPETQEGQTLADQRASGARPYFVHIKPEQVLGWRSERINGVETLTQLRLDEYVEEPDGEWNTKQVRQIRVLEPNAFKIYRKNEKEEWYLHREGAVSLGLIPLATVYCDRTGFMTARPPLLDLAFLNVAHWQSDSDQVNILHVARVPILFASGFAKDSPIAVGANTAVSNDDPASSLQYVEHTGAAIEAGRQSLKDLEDRMSLMGAQLLVRQPGQKTATETRTESSESNSALSSMALNLEDALEQAIVLLGKWEGMEVDGSVELVTEFDDPLAGLTVADLLLAQSQGIISKETAFAELQRRDIVSDEVKWAEEAPRLATDMAEAMKVAQATAAAKGSNKAE